MTKNQKKEEIRRFALMLKDIEDDSDRMNWLESFDEQFGCDIPGWEDFLIAALEETGAAEARNTVEAFGEKYNRVDENGKLIFSRLRTGNKYQQVLVTFDAGKPEGEQLTVEGIPDPRKMNIDELRAYLKWLEEGYAELENEEPPIENADDFGEWEEKLEEIRELIDDTELRIQSFEENAG